MIVYPPPPRAFQLAKASSTAERPRTRRDQQGQPHAAPVATNSPSSASPSFPPRRPSRSIDVGEVAGGGRPRGGTSHRADSSGSGSGSGGGGDKSGDKSGGGSNELTAADAEQMMAAAEQRLLEGMLGGPALPESVVGGDESSGGGGGGDGGGGGADSGEGGGSVDVGVEARGDVTRSGAGLSTVARTACWLLLVIVV